MIRDVIIHRSSVIGSSYEKVFRIFYLVSECMTCNVFLAFWDLGPMGFIYLPSPIVRPHIFDIEMVSSSTTLVERQDQNCSEVAERQTCQDGDHSDQMP